MPAAQNGDGAAIECFENAEAICVSRDRVAPVKTMNDLVALWSNAFEMTDDSRLIAVNREAHRLREIDLDERYYRTVRIWKRASRVAFRVSRSLADSRCAVTIASSQMSRWSAMFSS